MYPTQAVLIQLKTNIRAFIKQNIELFLLAQVVYVIANTIKTDLTDLVLPSGVEVLWSKTQVGTPTA